MRLICQVLATITLLLNFQTTFHTLSDQQEVAKTFLYLKYLPRGEEIPRSIRE